MNRVPVLRGYYGHIADGEILVELLECRRSASATTGHYRCTEFTGHLILLAVEQSLTERCYLSGRLAVIYRRPEYYGVELRETLLDILHSVVTKTMARPETFLTGDAARYRPVAKIQNFSFYLVLVKGFRNFIQRSGGAAVNMRTSVYQQNFHNSVLIF